MIHNKKNKDIKGAAVYSVVVHGILFLIILGSTFWPKKEPLLLTDIDIAGEGEFREAMEKARTSGKTNVDLTGIEEGRGEIQRSISDQQNQKGLDGKDVPEMVDELKVPEEPLPELVSSQSSVATSLSTEPQVAEVPSTEPEPEVEPAAPVVVPIETPDETEKATEEKSEKSPEEEAVPKDEKNEEKAEKERKNKEKTDREKKAREKKKKQREKTKQKAKEKHKKKLEKAIKQIEKAKKKKDRRQKMLDIAEKAEKAARRKNIIMEITEETGSATAKGSSDDGNTDGAGRGDKGNGVGAFGIGNALEESDYELISGQIYPYWVVPSGVRDAENIVIEIHIELGDNGDVIPSSIKILDEKKYVTDHVFRAAADSARRAILQASPLSIPKEKLDTFRSITLRFNLKEALGE